MNPQRNKKKKNIIEGIEELSTLCAAVCLAAKEMVWFTSVIMNVKSETFNDMTTVNYVSVCGSVPDTHIHTGMLCACVWLYTKCVERSVFVSDKPSHTCCHVCVCVCWIPAEVLPWFTWNTVSSVEILIFSVANIGHYWSYFFNSLYYQHASTLHVSKRAYLSTTLQQLSLKKQTQSINNREYKCNLLIFNNFFSG